MVGWIKIHRSIQDHWIFKDDDKFKAWMIILLTVNFDNKKVLIKNTLLECGRGEALLSLDSWADRFGLNWNKSKVRRFFNLLENDSMIVLKSERVTTRLTVCNYDSYQDERHANETQTKRKRNANETQTTPTKERKEYKEGKEEIKNNDLDIFDSFRKIYKGTKRGNETEFNNFKKKHKDYKNILPKLKSMYENQLRQLDVKKQKGEFVPQPKNLQTYINNRSWEDEIMNDIQNINKPNKHKFKCSAMNFIRTFECDSEDEARELFYKDCGAYPETITKI